MTKNSSTSNSGSYYDEVFRRIQEMERKQMAEENNRNVENYLKNYKDITSTVHNIFSSYGYEIRPETIRA